MAKLSHADKQKLAKVCGMFGSNFAGERASAALQAERIVRDAGLTWFDVIAPVPEQTEPRARRQVNREREIIEFAAENLDILTQWERDFVLSVRRRGEMHGWRFTEKQRAIIDKIAEKMWG